MDSADDATYYKGLTIFKILPYMGKWYRKKNCFKVSDLINQSLTDYHIVSLSTINNAVALPSSSKKGGGRHILHICGIQWKEMV
jgi:hypothetical protein